MKTLLILMVALTIVSSGAWAQEPIATAGSAWVEPSAPVQQTVTTTSWVFKSPGEVTLKDLNKYEFEVFSQQLSETGEQVDYIPAGKASKYLFYDASGIMRIHKAAVKRKPCNNKVIKLKVPETRTTQIPVGQNGINGAPGRDGRDGAPGPQGPQGSQGLQGPATVIIAAQQQPMMGVYATPQPYAHFETPGANSMGGFVYATTEINATGGTGGTACNGPIDISNNNSNAPSMTNVNGNTIGIDGNANGTNTGNSGSTANSGNPPTQ